MAFLAPALSAIGEGAASAAGAVGSGLADVGSTLGSLFTGGGGTAPGALATSGTGIGNIIQGIAGAGAPSEASYLASLGQAVPAGVELAGPTVGTGGGFLSGLAHGFLGTSQALANPSAATSAGTGVGQLLQTLGSLGGGGGGVPQPGVAPQPIVNLGTVRHFLGTEMAPAATPPQSGPGPIMSLLKGLIGGL